MARKRSKGLTDRETEILSILWELGEASVEDIRQMLTNPPSASTIRGLIRIMEERGLIADDGSGYGKHYHALAPKKNVQTSAAQRLVDTFFSGSTEALLLHLMDEGKVDFKRLEALREQLRKKANPPKE